MRSNGFCHVANSFIESRLSNIPVDPTDDGSWQSFSEEREEEGNGQSFTSCDGTGVGKSLSVISNSVLIKKKLTRSTVESVVPGSGQCGYTFVH